ncbi:hypothetical protein HNY73_015416 [Argiope bruennichi]|uniref:Uncharacterized protein n=1 Tax=Argiope bruennichi TaxID=94029 RepID=A0A8T0ES85_ARGBR|nr:hypothetical protein HNY73_015416 [Argiope bruennichi]
MSGENVLKSREENDCFKKRACSLPIPCEYIPNAKRVSLRIEDSVEILNKGKRVSKEVWRVLKILLFATCSTFYLSQSMEFYKRFCEYPTTTSMEVINPEFYKMPAVTVCLRNLIKRSKFCAENPYSCEKPRKRKSFCKKHPYMCKKKVGDLMISFGFMSIVCRASQAFVIDILTHSS